jgi:influenza virus NS1A-binding protein
LHLLTGVCDLNELIYCIGGWNGQVGIKQCDVLDPTTGQWSSIAPLQTGADRGTIVRFQAITLVLNFHFFWDVTCQMSGSQLIEGFRLLLGC